MYIYIIYLCIYNILMYVSIYNYTLIGASGVPAGPTGSRLAGTRRGPRRPRCLTHPGAGQEPVLREAKEGTARGAGAAQCEHEQ